MANRKGKGHKALERAVKGALGGKRDKLRLVPALMGAYVAGLKTIKVAGRPDFVWVRLRGATSEVAQAFNDVCGEHFDLPILIKRDEFAHDRWRVHGRDIRAYADWGGVSYLPPHAESHSFGDPEQTGGIDPVWIFKRQYMPLLPRPQISGTMSVYLEPDFYYFQGEYHWWPGSGTADLTGYIPTGAFSGKFVTVYIDGDSGSPQYIEGPEFDFAVGVWGGAVDFASYISLPDPSQGIPIAAVRLYTGSTSIGWGDIYDLRSPQQPLGTTGSYISVFDESVYQGAVEGINFVGDGIEVTVSGSFAHVFVTGTGGGGVGGGTGTATYMLVGVPEPIDSITGAYWKTPGGTPYASGSINAFIDGISQVKGLAFEELHPESGTFQYFEVPPTGTLHEVKFGVVVIAAGQKGDTGDTGAEGATGAAGAAGPEGATGSQGLPGAVGTFGVFVTEEGVPIGTGTILDFVGEGVEASISGTVARIFITGAPTDIFPPVTGTVVLYDEQNLLGSVEKIVVEGDPAYAAITGAFGYISFSGSVGPQGAEGATGSIGLTGAEGATGSIGLTGAEGATGSQGIQGIEGATGSAGIEGATGSQGIQGIEGATGSQGIQGIEGATGSQGIQGIEGATGSQGIQGIEGATGSQGIQGIEGATGSQGIQGIEGATGSQGIQGIEGATGSQGIQGIEGATGSQGIQGIEGATGSQGIQGIEGATGSQGIQGIEGATGSQGIQGIEGATGSAGIEGATGSQGIQGIEGATGSQGIQGIEGATGSAGIEGATGSQGIQGIEGATGSQGIQGIEGATGSQGIQGIEGATGSAGAEGATGSVGATGPAGTGTFGIFGLNSGLPLGTGAWVDFRDNLTATISGTVITIDGLAGGGAGVDQIGVYGLDDGVPLGTGSWINWNEGLTVTLSGTVLNPILDESFPAVWSTVQTFQDRILVDGLAGFGDDIRVSGSYVVGDWEIFPSLFGSIIAFDYQGQGIRHQILESKFSISGTVAVGKLLELANHLGDPSDLDFAALSGWGNLVSVNKKPYFVTDEGTVYDLTATGTPGATNATYIRSGEAVPLVTVTGGYWKVPDEVFATGSLAIMVNGIWQIPVTDFQEHYPSSGTFVVGPDGVPTGTYVASIWGAPA